MTQSSPKKIRVSNIKLTSFASPFVLFVICSAAFGQSNHNPGRNNPYSPSPTRKVKQDEQLATPVKSGHRETEFFLQGQDISLPEDRATVAQRTFQIAKSAETHSMPLTDIYKVGVGDVLFVNLKNSAHGSGYYTVRPDGTIDFPMAGDEVVVADQTVDIIEEMLTSGITLFPDPQVEVKVREYVSHKITVFGMVDNPGAKSLKRESMPLYAIRAESGVDSRATKVLITRSTQSNRESYNLRDANTDNLTICPGDTVEFTSGSSSNGELYFISGQIISGGQKDLTTGLTLFQAVVASGGAKGDPKKAIIRRKNDYGMFDLVEYNLREIKGGKSADPPLAPGDVIEIRK